ARSCHARDARGDCRRAPRLAIVVHVPPELRRSRRSTVKAALHVHSTYSDGELSIADLRQVYLALGCRIVCMTDHAEAFGLRSLQSYVSECRALSGDGLQFLAGMEFACRNGMHVLGFGVTSRVPSNDPQTVIRHIKDAGGIA